jgi:hypothetical protein
MYDELCKYENNLSMSDNIESRLKKSLDLYLDELNKASDRLNGKKTNTVYKALK